MFRFARIQEPRDWFWPILVTLVLLYWAKRRYSKDAAELHRWQRGLLLLIRCGVIISLLLFYAQPQWERLVGASRVALLIDTSASMSTKDQEEEQRRSEQLHENTGETQTETASETENEPGAISRMDDLAEWLIRSDLIEKLREKHDVVVYRFDSALNRIGTHEQHRAGRRGESQLDENPGDSEINTEKSAADSKNEWIHHLKADGAETRLGDSLRDLLQRERGQPLTGVLLFTDGARNAGDAMENAEQLAHSAQTPVYTFGFGMKQQPLNFRVLNLDVPERAFPADPFKFKAQIEMQGGEVAQDSPEAAEKVLLPVELWMLRDAESSSETPEASEAIPAAAQMVEKRELEINAGSTREIEFEVSSEQIGKIRFYLRVLPPKEDRIAEDNLQNASVEIVDRRDRVLLFSGGPLRDYQFLVNLLYRDKSVEVDAYIPWASSGISQSVDKILDAFPSDRVEMAQYDCVVAFDPDWRQLSNEQIDILEHWVARQGGGLITVAGAVNLADTVTGWTSDPAMDKIRALYPVDVASHRMTSVLAYRADSQPWPLNWSRAGEEAEFLRPLDTEAESRAVWSEFPGFYSFFIVNALKPTATMYAKSSSPDAAGTSGVAPLFAEHFYGSGRVFFIGSGEMWRLRMMNDKYFEKIYTKLIRHVSQGRLQQRSQWGSLATDKKRYTLGASAAIRATAYDAQFNPLELEKITLDLISPDAKIHQLPLQADPNVPGAYSGHVPMILEGTWNFRLNIPDTNEVLEESVQVRMSDLESENPSRNENLLTQLAQQTGGMYFQSLYEVPLETVEISETEGAENTVSLLDRLTIRSQRAVLDSMLEEETMRLFLYIFCTLLCTEWLLRRLMKLA